MEVKLYPREAFISTPVEQVQVGDWISTPYEASGSGNYSALPIVLKRRVLGGYYFEVRLLPGVRVREKASVEWDGCQPIITLSYNAEYEQPLLILKRSEQPTGD